jgi:hypothetical protein
LICKRLVSILQFIYAHLRKSWLHFHVIDLSHSELASTMPVLLAINLLKSFKVVTNLNISVRAFEYTFNIHSFTLLFASILTPFWRFIFSFLFYSSSFNKLTFKVGIIFWSELSFTMFLTEKIHQNSLNHRSISQYYFDENNFFTLSLFSWNNFPIIFFTFFIRRLCIIFFLGV